MDTQEKIIINGNLLTPSQIMTIKVALDSFAVRLKLNGLGNDEHGLTMTQSYLKSVDKIKASLSDLSLIQLSTVEDNVQQLRETSAPLDWQEADLIVNGTKLNSAESMTLRGALESFSFDVYEHGGNKKQKKKMIELHSDSIIAIRQALYQNVRPTMKY